MDCTSAQERLSPLLDDALPAEEADAVLGHLRFCTGCSKAHEALRAVVRRVKALGQAPLPIGFQDRLKSRREGGASAPAWLKLVPVAAAAAVVIAVGLSQRKARPTASEAADDELRVAMKRAPELAPPPPEAIPKRPAPAPEFSNASQAEFLAKQRDELGIRAMGKERAQAEEPQSSLISGSGSLTDPANRREVEATIRNMAAMSRAIREREQDPEVAIEGKTAPVLGKGDEAAGAAFDGAAPQERWTGTHSADQEGTRTVYDETEWRKLWKTLSPAPLPALDFSKQQVVGVFLGPRPTGGYAAEIVDVVQTSTALIVQWRERAPEDGLQGPEGATSPYALRVVPRTDLPVRYQKIR